MCFILYIFYIIIIIIKRMLKQNIFHIYQEISLYRQQLRDTKCTLKDKRNS